MRVPLRSRVVTDPSGSRWRVSIRWMPWMPRKRLHTEDASELGWFVPDDPSGCLIGIVLVLALALVLPILLLFGELVLLFALVLPLTLLLAAIGVRRWILEVQFEDGEAPERAAALEPGDHVIVQRHRGVRAAERALEELAARIERGELDPVGD